MEWFKNLFGGSKNPESGKGAPEGAEKFTAPHTGSSDLKPPTGPKLKPAYEKPLEFKESEKGGIDYVYLRTNEQDLKDANGITVDEEKGIIETKNTSIDLNNKERPDRKTGKVIFGYCNKIAFENGQISQGNIRIVTEGTSPTEKIINYTVFRPGKDGNMLHNIEGSDQFVISKTDVEKVKAEKKPIVEISPVAQEIVKRITGKEVKYDKDEGKLDIPGFNRFPLTGDNEKRPTLIVKVEPEIDFDDKDQVTKQPDGSLKVNYEAVKGIRFSGYSESEFGSKEIYVCAIPYLDNKDGIYQEKFELK